MEFPFAFECVFILCPLMVEINRMFHRNPPTPFFSFYCVLTFDSSGLTSVLFTWKEMALSLKHHKPKPSIGIAHRIVRNPHVIIIGISKYDLPWTSLSCVARDIDKMKGLWRNKFKYPNVTVVTEKIGSDYISKSKLNSSLNDISILKDSIE